MTSIIVERSGFGIVVAEDGDAEATALLDGLPALRAARYLTATPALRQALRDADAEVVEAVLPHLDGAVVVPEAGLANEGDDGRGADGARLAEALGVSVIAPDGRFIRCEGTLFSLGAGDGWITQSPRGARVRSGRRYPAPGWQSQLPHALQGAAHIPAGLWITAGAEPRHAVRLAGIAVRERQLLVVAGSPSEPAPTRERLLELLRSLPVETRSAVVLVGYGRESLPLETVRALAAALDQPLRVAHGVEIDGVPVRIDGDEAGLPAALALESVCAPDGTVTLERWAAPPGLVAADAASYRLGETPRRRGRAGDRWVVDVVAAGLVVRPESQPLADAAELEAPSGSLAIFVQCDGAQRPAALPSLLGPLRDRLAQRSAVTLHPLDAAARRVVRDAYPGHWAPTEALAITADGRLVAAAADASGDTAGGDAARGDAARGDAARGDAARGDAARGDAARGVTPSGDAAGGDAAGSVVEAGAGAVRETDEHPGEAIAAPSQDHALPEARTSGDVAQRSAAPAAREAPRADRTPATVDAVIGAGAAAPVPQERAGSLRRRARDARVTNVPGVDEAAAAWYAAAAPQRAADPMPGERPPSTPPASTVPASTVPASAAPASTVPASTVPASTSPTSATLASTLPARTPPASTPPSPPPSSRAAVGAAAPPPVRAQTAQGAAVTDAAVDAVAPEATGGAASDALARALQGSASTRPIGGASRGAVAPPRQTTARRAVEHGESAAAHVGGAVGERVVAGALVTQTPQPAPAAAADETPAAALPVEVDASASPEAAPRSQPQRSRQAIEVPIGARSTPDQRHRVRTALGSRYDVASRSVSQLLAQQPGMRGAVGERSAMLTWLSLVRVFAAEPDADYDLDFHTCLAEGLSMLPTARSVVVRGIPVERDAAPGAMLRLRTPLIAAAADGPAAGPSEALIWTTGGRRLDRVLHGSPGAADVVLPAGVLLRVLGSATSPVPRLLLAEEGTDAVLALARLQAAAEARGDLGAHADDRWFGDLPLAA